MSNIAIALYNIPDTCSACPFYRKGGRGERYKQGCMAAMPPNGDARIKLARYAVTKGRHPKCPLRKKEVYLVNGVKE